MRNIIPKVVFKPIDFQDIPKSKYNPDYFKFRNKGPGEYEKAIIAFLESNNDAVEIIPSVEHPFCGKTFINSKIKEKGYKVRLISRGTNERFFLVKEELLH